jgi:hypothetical protein
MHDCNPLPPLEASISWTRSNTTRNNEDRHLQETRISGHAQRRKRSPNIEREPALAAEGFPVKEEAAQLDEAIKISLGLVPP